MPVRSQVSHAAIVDSVIDEISQRNIKLLATHESGMGHRSYLDNLAGSYDRTVSDLQRLVPAGGKILEIGSYLGVVSISLKNLGYNVSAVELPEYQQSSDLQSLYQEHGIKFAPVNLRTDALPFEDEQFDAVILCEVLEHLNFNPLPALKDMNRVLKPDGILYVGMPNLASFGNRIQLLLGKSFRDPINAYLHQLDPQQNMLVGMHWREYTMQETKEILETMEFRCAESSFYVFWGAWRRWSAGWILRKLIYAVPSMRPFQVVVGRKRKMIDKEFWRTQANT